MRVLRFKNIFLLHVRSGFELFLFLLHLPPSRAPHLSLTTSAYGPHSYFHFFLSFHLAYLTLFLSFALLLTPLSVLLSLELAVFETLRTSVSVFTDVVPEQ